MRTLGAGSWLSEDFVDVDEYAPLPGTLWEPACGGAVLRPEHEAHEDYPLDPPEQWLVPDRTGDLVIDRTEEIFADLKAADSGAQHFTPKRKKHRHG